jgi:hypothetical protein
MKTVKNVPNESATSRIRRLIAGRGRAGVAAGASAFFAAGSLAGTINVPLDYPTIQAAINNAGAGDLVLVDSAFSPYSGPGNVNLDTLAKAITIRSTGGPGSATIDCGGTAAGFVISQGETTGTFIDGFKVINCLGYGLVITGSGPLVSNCSITAGADLSNASPILIGCDLSVGGVRITGGSPDFFTCSFDSGGLTAASSDVSINGCTARFCDSPAVVVTGTILTVINCPITDNYDAVVENGGGVVLAGASQGYIYYSDISRNHKDPDQSRGGGLSVTGGSGAWIIGSTISDNSVGGGGGGGYSGEGGGIYVDASSTANLSTTTIKGNIAYDDFDFAGNGGGVMARGKVNYTGCTISSNRGSGGGVCATTTQTFSDCLITQNRGAAIGGGLWLQGGNTTVTDSVISFNTAVRGFMSDESWGGGVAVIGGTATFERTLFDGNISQGSGWFGDGGGAAYSNKTSTFDNCIFNGNKDTWSGQGGALNFESLNNKVINCTFFGNTAPANQGGAIADNSLGIPVTSCIFWSNTATPFLGAPVVTYSDVEFGYTGANNIIANPQFVNAAILDFRLLQGSLCIDKGSNAAIPLGITKDFNLSPRVRHGSYFAFGNPVVDMGATEFRLPIIEMGADPGTLTFADFEGGDPGDPKGPIDNKGTWMVTGGYGGNKGIPGRVYVHAADADGNWAPYSVITPPDGHDGDFFGASVALDGAHLAIGAPRNSEMGSLAGAVYIFRLEGEQWIFEAKLTAPDASAGAQFGYSVAMEGDRLLAGAWRADPDGITNAGAAYIFRRDGQPWANEAVLAASDAEPGASFGWAVSLSEGAALIGAPIAQQSAGQAYIFRRAGSEWFEEAVLASAEPTPGDKFGHSVGLWGRRAIAGAPWRDRNQQQDSGAAYLFEGNFGVWEPVTEFATDSPGAATFGRALSIEGDVIAIGAPGTAEGTGQADVFSLGADQWEHNATVIAPGGLPGDQFGHWVELSAGVLAPSSPGYDGPEGPNQGAVYPFDLYGQGCYPDFTGDGTLDLFDFLGFVNDFNAGGPDSDCDANGYQDVFDFLCFINAFNSGC